MPTQIKTLPVDSLTIVSRSLLRASSNEWLDPRLILERIDGSALATVLSELNDPQSAGSFYYRQRALFMFDCMLRVIDEPVIKSIVSLGDRRFGELQDIFYGAIASNKFNAFAEASRVTLARALYTLLRDLSQKSPVYPSSFIPNSNKNLPSELAHLFDRITLNENEVEKLKPFLLTDKNGTDYNVLLKPMVSVLGRNFTRRFHSTLRTIAAAKAKSTALRDFGTTFAKFLESQSNTGQVITEAQLQHGDFVREMLVDFMLHHFKKMYVMNGGRQEGTMASLQKLWSRYRLIWDILVKKNVVAEPTFGFPEGKPSLTYLKEVRHVRKISSDNDNPSIVTHKLLTPVPLHLSDEATTSIIFKQIEKDFKVAQDWLDSHLEKLWQFYENGLSLAGPEPYSLAKEKELADALDPKKNPNALVEAIRYFKHEHNGYVDTNRVKTTAYPEMAARGRVSKIKLAQLLGIPNRNDAMALMGYLASIDGRFTESALAHAVLLNRRGKRINAVNSGDNTLTLSVLKERAGQSGWHDIIITGRAYTLVQRWIHLTTPLRDYMKKNHLKGWQNLFIYAGSPLGNPAFFQSSNINSFFRDFAQRESKKLGSLASLITISRIRAQRGILVFLEKFDVKAMARELGNNEDTSMRHYLPDAIWEYFSVRWIRIFQNLLIVEATRDSPNMARALHIKNINELDEFLNNHALKPLIPKKLEDATLPIQRAKQDNSENNQLANLEVHEIMVAASRTIFATLLSVKDAVVLALDSGERIEEKAFYWYEFTKRLQSHIEADDYPDRAIKNLLKSAAQDVRPEHYAKVIRA